jgi:hypothetical protein
MDDKTKPADGQQEAVETSTAPGTDTSLTESGDRNHPSPVGPASDVTKSNDMKPGPHQLQGGMRS